MITLANGQPLRGDLLLKYQFRSDLSPVPETLEVTARLDNDLLPFFQEGQIVKAGRFDGEFKIIKSSPNNQSQGVQGERVFGSVSIIAVLNNCRSIVYRRDTAVIKRDTSLAEIYRACGSTAAVENDIPAAEFACFAGGYASEGIARVLQEEAATVMYTGAALRFMRLRDLFTQTPAQKMAVDTSQNITSDFLERHLVPSFVSTDDDGALETGNTQSARAIFFNPLTDARRLNNMTQVLLQKKTLKSSYAPQLLAGNIIEIVGVPYVIITAAHVVDRTQTGVGQNEYSKFWLGVLA